MFETRGHNGLLDGAESYEAMAKAQFKSLNAQMQKQPVQQFVCLDRFTIADLHLFIVVHFTKTFPPDAKPMEKFTDGCDWINDHYERTLKRPSALAFTQQEKFKKMQQ